MYICAMGAWIGLFERDITTQQACACRCRPVERVVMRDSKKNNAQTIFLTMCLSGQEHDLLRNIYSRMLPLLKTMYKTYIWMSTCSIQSMSYCTHGYWWQTSTCVNRVRSKIHLLSMYFVTRIYAQPRYAYIMCTINGGLSCNPDVKNTKVGINLQSSAHHSIEPLHRKTDGLEEEGMSRTRYFLDVEGARVTQRFLYP